MEAMNIEPTQNEPTGFMQRWHERWRVRCGIPSLTSKIIYVCLMLLIIAVSSVIHLSLPSNDPKKNVSIPDSELQNLAVYYMKSLEPNLLPCEDFYTFACGNLWYQYEQEREHFFSTRAMMEKHTRVSLDDFLTKPLNTSDSATSRQLKIFHQMCINKTKVETEGIEPVLALLKEIGGWPLLTNYWENNESWETIVGSVNRAGFATFFPYDLQLLLDPYNSSVMAMMLKPLPATRFFPNETTDYVKLVALLLNATNDRLDYDVKDCIDFESELLELTNRVAKRVAFLTFEDLRKVFPEIAWETFFRNVFVSTGIEVSSNEPFYLTYSMYNLRVFELLNKTSTKIIRNYLVWRLIVEAIPLMSEKFREAKSTFEQGTVAQSRNLDCVDALISNADVSIGYFYIKNHLDGLAQKKADGMIKNIKSQAYQFLKNISWMDNDTNAKIIDSLKNLEFKVPHPDDNTDVMETLDFQSNDTFFANYRRLVEAQRKFQYGRLRMSLEANRQLIPFVSAVNSHAEYVRSVNISFAVFFAAAFQRPLFSASQPMYLNYGGIGFTMAHEMTHAMRLLSVCRNETCPSFDRFQEKKDCMETLYNGYLLKQVNKTVDGKATLQENICDLIGLKLSYRAYEEFAKDSEEQLLPGLEYTERQWFWINVATSFCEYESDFALRNIILNSSHSPGEARVNVAFANTDEFSRDFKCPIGSRMNPVRKCEFER